MTELLFFFLIFFFILTLTRFPSVLILFDNGGVLASVSLAAMLVGLAVL